MKKDKFIYTILLFCSALGMNGQTTQKLTATKVNDYAIIYSLPKTAIDVTIVTKKTVETPGEFYLYAKRILNIDKPISESSTRYTIDKIIIRTHGEPNEDLRYAVKFNSGSSPYMLISPSNIPLAVNTEEVYYPEVEMIPEPEAAKPTPLEKPAARQIMTEEMLRATTPLKRAQTAAEQLYALRQSRSDLLTGNADQMPPDGQSLQLMLDNLNAQEAALTAMFTGTQQISTQVSTFTYVPSANHSEVEGYVVARLSQLDGIVDAEDLSGAPIKLDYKVVQQGEIPKNEKGIELPFPKNGFAYCIPGKANVKIRYEGKTIANETLNVAQAGIVYGLAPNSFTDKKSPMYLIMDPSTGAAVEIGATK